MNFSLNRTPQIWVFWFKIKQVAGAGFDGLLWDIWKLEKVWDRNRQRTHTHTEKEITEAPLIAVPIDHREQANTCLLNLTFNKKFSSHSLQFASKYHVFLDSLRVHIWEHTYHSLSPTKYHVFLDSLWPQTREHTHCSFGPAALYYTGVELEKI